VKPKPEEINGIKFHAHHRFPISRCAFIFPLCGKVKQKSAIDAIEVRGKPKMVQNEPKRALGWRLCVRLKEARLSDWLNGPQVDCRDSEHQARRETTKVNVLMESQHHFLHSTHKKRQIR
jgi:hypothetical protein